MDATEEPIISPKRKPVSEVFRPVRAPGQETHPKPWEPVEEPPTKVAMMHRPDETQPSPRYMEQVDLQVDNQHGLPPFEQRFALYEDDAPPALPKQPPPQRPMATSPRDAKTKPQFIAVSWNFDLGIMLLNFGWSQYFKCLFRSQKWTNLLLLHNKYDNDNNLTII